MRVFPIKLMSQWDKANNLLDIMQSNKPKKVYKHPYINSGNAETIVKNAIKSTSKFTKNEQGQLRYSFDVPKVVDAVFIRKKFDKIVTILKTGRY